MLRLAALALVLAVSVALLRTPTPRQDSEDVAVAAHEVPLDAESAAAPARLARALTFATLASPEVPQHIGNPAPFQELHQHLEDSFPLVYQKLKHERVNEFSLLFTWQGSSPELRPLLAMSHMDVVPATFGPPPYNWTHPPFGGVTADGFIWGRGAIDIKSSLFQQLEAISLLLRRGYQPKRTILFAVGHDEEVGGEEGAGHIAGLLRSRGVELELVLDEGGLIMMDGFKGPSLQVVDMPIAVVGTSEKGYETWEVEVHGNGGHSSMPPVDGSSVASRISRILAALDAYPSPTRLDEPTTSFLRALAPAAKLAPLRIALNSANNWVVNPILGQLMGQLAPEVAAFVRTTCAVVSVAAGGIADNVMPKKGSILLNFRILPGQDSSTIRDYLRVVTLKEAQHVTLHRRDRAFSPAPVAPSSGKHWQLVKQAILETLTPPKGLIVVPYLVNGMTDSRHYNELAGGRVYRFCPHRFGANDLQLFHGVDERIAVEDFVRGIGFYARLFELASGDEGTEEAAADAAAADAASAAQVGSEL